MRNPAFPSPPLQRKKCKSKSICGMIGNKKYLPRDEMTQNLTTKVYRTDSNNKLNLRTHVHDERHVKQVN